MLNFQGGRIWGPSIKLQVAMITVLVFDVQGFKLKGLSRSGYNILVFESWSMNNKSL